MLNLHVIPQRYEHDELIIHGSVEAFRSLRDGIDRFLAAKQSGDLDYSSNILKETFFPSDGEGFNVVLMDYNEKKPRDKSNYSEYNKP